ncbi:MAG: M56 family metallopeptidase [Candidatus Sulfotelmatobacter sp.]
MIPAPAFQASTNLLAQLADPAARALALSGALGLSLAAFRVRDTAVRLFTWTTVLYAALAMPLLGWMLPPLPIPSPSFLQSAFVQHPTDAMYLEGAPSKLSLGGIFLGGQKTAQSIPKQERAKETARKVALPVAATPAAPSSFPDFFRWNTIAAAIYLAGGLILLIRFFVGLAFSNRLVRAAQTIAESRVTQRLASRSHASHLDVIPRAAESQFISVPVTMGALRPMILLPSAWREWDDAKLDAVIAHEVSHVARRDALTQRLSLLHRAIFWFSPLAWWLDRHLADLAEQASDEAALSCGADRKDYARILLGFFEALHAAPGRVWWQGVSMAKAGQAEHRLERILSWKGSVAMRLQKSIAVLVVTLATPVVYLAASAHPAYRVGFPNAMLAQDQAPPAAGAASAPKSNATTPPEPGSAPDPALAPAAVTGAISAPPHPRLAPAVGVAPEVDPPAFSPIAPVAPLTPMQATMPVVANGRSGFSGSSSDHGFSYHYGFDDEQRFVIVSGKTNSLTMSGTREDARHVEKLRKSIPGDFIWFESDEKSYVIRDQATIGRALKLWAPQEELGKKQEELGKQQQALGKQQQELGAKMEQVHVNVPDMTSELDKLKTELKQLTSGATSEQVGHIQSEIGELQSRIGTLQSQAGEQQSKLGEQMSALGEKQGKLGAQQGELGRQQGELAEKASHEMKLLLEEAIKKGIAQPEL